MLLPTQAIILHQGAPGPREIRLSRILDFFGVPWAMAEVSSLEGTGGNFPTSVVFGSAQTIAVALAQGDGISASIAKAPAFYLYADEDRTACENALRALLGDTRLSLQDGPRGDVSLYVASEPADLAGPMAGLQVTSRLRTEDAVLTGRGNLNLTTVISAGDAPVFARFQRGGSSIFFCASLNIVDIDQPVGRGFYDVKDHFCSVVPLVLFIRFAFPDVVWAPQELGACLIIDDPLLRTKYGFCDFPKLSELMRRRGFTTNIAFIPWNWRRTSRAGGEFFKNTAGDFSISIHGCDHTGGEFGTTSLEVLHNRAQMAQRRMKNHETRTGIHHDPIMVFPQGVFSSDCPAVLKRCGFLSAVNTELIPVDSQNVRTRIADAWDVAIMRYGDFPIFTRRYPFHGVENFAFDLLLGKPCLIVTHHDFFKDGGTKLIELIEKIQSLNCRIQWRSLGEVIRRACRRRRAMGAGTVEVDMYASELLIDNPSHQPIEVTIRKRKSQDDLISEVLCDGKPAEWTSEDGQIVLLERISPESEKLFRVTYQEPVQDFTMRRTLRYELSVAARRILSEFRDDYISRSRFLSTQAEKLKGALKKAI
jgi:hypothetical protein